DGGSAGGDVADRAAPDRDGANARYARVHTRLVIHTRISTALRHQKISHIHRHLRRFWRAPALEFQVYLRLFGAVSIEFSDEKSCHERATSRIGGNSAQPLRKRLENFSLCSCYVEGATVFPLITSMFVSMAIGS